MICPNCQKYLVPKAPYCNQCGQKTALDEEFTFQSILANFFGGIFSVDGKLVKTLKILFKPGCYYQDFVNGKRARYMHPIKLFVFLSLVLLGLNFSFTTSKSPVQISKPLSGNLTWGESLIDSSEIQSLSIPELLEKYPQEKAIDRFWLKQLLHFNKDVASYVEYVTKKLPWMFFIFVPLIALVSILLERKKGVAYFKHVLFWMNTTSAFLLCYGLISIVSSNEYLHAVVFVFFPTFAFWSLQKVFPTQNLLFRVLKWLAYLLLGTVLLLVSALLILISSFALF